MGSTNANSLKETCSALYEVLLGDNLVSLLDDENKNDDPKLNNKRYWDQVQLMFIFRVLVSRTQSELAMTTLCRRPTIGTTSDTANSESLLVQQLQLFRMLLNNMEHVLEEQHQSSTTTTGSEVGRIMNEFSKAYNLSRIEIRVVQLLVLAKAIPSPSILELLLQRDDGNETLAYVAQGDEKMGLEHTQVRYACGITTLDWTKLANEDHVLCSDHILVFQEEDYSNNKLSVSEEACRALMGLELTMEDKLKLSGTKLLTILEEINGGNNGETTLMDLAASTSSTGRSSSDNATTSHAKATINSMLKTLKIGGSSMSDDGDDPVVSGGVLVKEEDIAAAIAATSHDDGNSKVSDRDEESSGEMITGPDTLEATTAEGSSKDDGTATVEEDPKQPKAYNTELEYLKDMFEVVMHKVILSRERIGKELRAAAVSDNRQPSWMRGGNDTTSKKSVGEIYAKIKLAQRKIELSLELTRQEGTFFPRLELLVEQLQLHDFEKFVLVYLAGSMISPIFKSCIKSDDYSRDNVCVGDLLLAYFDSFADQVAGRTYFYRTSKLAKKGLIRFTNTYRNVADLTDQEVALDRRVLDCIVGLDKESTQISHGSYLYDPKVSLESVVLPKRMKETITAAVTHFDQFRSYRKHNPDFDDNISYGVGLVLMFAGASGTGKTMTANAIASKLGKKVLLVNFPFMSQNNNSNDDSSRWQAIFREAELSDAVSIIQMRRRIFSKTRRFRNAIMKVFQRQSKNSSV